jgi:hypothetical protein
MAVSNRNTGCRITEFITLFNMGNAGPDYSELELEKSPDLKAMCSVRIRNPETENFGLDVRLDAEQAHKLADVLRKWAGPRPSQPHPKWRMGA